MEQMWYWQYTLKVWDEIDKKEEMRSGVIAAEDIVKAIETLYSYYGEDIMDVQSLKPILSTVFDFKSASEESDFDFEVHKKM